MRKAVILDTSWLLELYRVPGYFDGKLTSRVRSETARIAGDGCELFVTVPVLFEVASHITHVRDGQRRRTLGKKLLDDITSSMDRDEPWTIAVVGGDILLRTEDLLHLAERFLQASGPNYSFANISIIDLATELRERNHVVGILTSNTMLRSYSC